MFDFGESPASRLAPANDRWRTREGVKLALFSPTPPSCYVCLALLECGVVYSLPNSQGGGSPLYFHWLLAVLMGRGNGQGLIMLGWRYFPLSNSICWHQIPQFKHSLCAYHLVLRSHTSVQSQDTHVSSNVGNSPHIESIPIFITPIFSALIFARLCAHNPSPTMHGISGLIE